MTDCDPRADDVFQILLPRCETGFCDEIAQVYVDKTGEDLCEDCGERWSDDEKIPIRIDDGEVQAGMERDSQ